MCASVVVRVFCLCSVLHDRFVLYTVYRMGAEVGFAGARGRTMCNGLAPGDNGNDRSKDARATMLYEKSRISDEPYTI